MFASASVDNREEPILTILFQGVLCSHCQDDSFHIECLSRQWVSVCFGPSTMTL